MVPPRRYLDLRSHTMTPRDLSTNRTAIGGANGIGVALEGMMKPSTLASAIVMMLVLLLTACGGGSDPDPCSGVTCSFHGTCIVETGAARCDCAPGYDEEGLACVEVGADGDADGDVDGDVDGDADRDVDEDDDLDPCLGNLEFRWVVSARGWDDGRQHQGGNGVGISQEGRIIVAGTFTDSVVFGEGEPNETMVESSGNRDIYVGGFSPSGALAWVDGFGGALGESEEWAAIDVLSDGSSLAVGGCIGDVTFGEGESVETTIYTTGGWSDAFAIRYNPDGTLAWAKALTATDSAGASGVDSREDGSFVVGGGFNDIGGTFCPGDPLDTPLELIGDSNLFVSSHEADGALLWVAFAGGDGPLNHPTGGVVALEDGGAIVSGRYASAITFGRGESRETTLNSAGGLDVFLAKFNPDGSLDWARRAIGAGNDYANGVDRLSDGSLILTGSFEDAITFDPGGEREVSFVSHGGFDGFVARYDEVGELQWAIQIGAGDEDGVGDVAAFGVHSFLVTGSYADVVTFGLGDPAETTLRAAGSTDVFVGRYTADGTLLWVRSAGGEGDDLSGAVAGHEDGRIVVVGRYRDTATFDVAEEGGTTMTSLGGFDSFIMMLQDCSL